MAESKFELRENQIMIFKNKKRQKDTHPEYTGKLEVNGEIRDIKLWVKTGATGEKYFSGLHEVEWKPTQQSTPPPPVPETDNEKYQNGTDLPF